jgi:hypothetical protein
MSTRKVINTGLTPKQEKFCQIYCSPSEFFANGVQSYIEAYDIDVSKNPSAYASARTQSYNLLTNHDILGRINELLDLQGLNDQFVDKQLLFVIQQNADMGAKVQAMKEYNKLKQRIQDKLDLTTNGKDLPTPIYGGLSVSESE